MDGAPAGVPASPDRPCGPGADMEGGPEEVEGDGGLFRPAQYPPVSKDAPPDLLDGRGGLSGKSGPRCPPARAEPALPATWVVGGWRTSLHGPQTPSPHPHPGCRWGLGLSPPDALEELPEHPDHLLQGPVPFPSLRPQRGGGVTQTLIDSHASLTWFTPPAPTAPVLLPPSSPRLRTLCPRAKEDSKICRDWLGR